MSVKQSLTVKVLKINYSVVSCMDQVTVFFSNCILLVNKVLRKLLGRWAKPVGNTAGC